jgi:hypothetical protein
MQTSTIVPGERSYCTSTVFRQRSASVLEHHSDTAANIPPALIISINGNLS